MQFDGAALLAGIKAEIPKFKIVDKRKSKFMRFLNVFVRVFNPKFMDAFITTIGFTVYWSDSPGNFDAPDDYDSLWHEARHALQAKRWTRVGFGWLYLFPHSLSPLALLSLLAIWFSFWWLMALVALMTLAPWPAPWRARWELQAFEAQIYILKAQGYQDLSGWVTRRVDVTFGGWDYFKMVWCKARIRRKLEALVKNWKKIQNPFVKVVAFKDPWE